jgi:hypothetical protein
MDQSIERWLPVVGFEWYEISDHGRLKRVAGAPGGHWGIVTHVQVSPKGGYLQYRMRLNTKKTARYVHRLVAEHFVSGRAEGLEVNHKDGDKRNNHWTNLEWCSHQHNVTHACETGLQRWLGDIAGTRSGKLVILGRSERRDYVHVECDCGRIYEAQQGGIIRGAAKQCLYCGNSQKAKLPRQRRRSAKAEQSSSTQSPALQPSTCGPSSSY